MQAGGIVAKAVERAASGSPTAADHDALQLRHLMAKYVVLDSSLDAASKADYFVDAVWKHFAPLRVRLLLLLLLQLLLV